MSLDTVVEDIRDEARERAEELRHDAEARADEIIEDAESEAEEIREQRAAETERQIQQEREQRLSSAKLEAKQGRLEARRDVLADIREQVEEEIATLDDGREELTRALLKDAVAEFDDADTIDVFGKPDDAELIETIVSDYDDCEYAGEYDCLGGVVVEAEDSRIRVNNTFDSVLENVWEENLRDISERLFEQ